MFRHCVVLCVIFISASSYDTVSTIQDSARTPIKVVEPNDFILDNQKLPGYTEKVSLKLFYESLCPDCIEFDPEFAKVANKLLQYLNIHTYPYGNAHTTKNANGTIIVECQHGVPECYGNKLHACAIEVLANVSLYLDYNACMIKSRSNDTAAEKCGKEIGVDIAKVNDVKNCAKGARGQELLVHYGEESERANFQYVPYVLINGEEWKGEVEDFMNDVCSAFNSPPKPCARDILV